MAFSLTQLQDPESSTFTYFLSDKRTKEAIVIDPVLEQVIHCDPNKSAEVIELH